MNVKSSVVGVSSGGVGTSSSSYVPFLELFPTLFPTSCNLSPLVLSDGYHRAVRVLDLTPGLHTAKAAMLYDGGNGSSGEGGVGVMETKGSRGYNDFLLRLGFLTPVRKLEFYSGGLDWEGGRDGDYQVGWVDGTGSR